MGAGHDHGVATASREKPLWWAFGLTATFLVAEVIGGLLTNSLALLSDAAHMGTDVIALAISLAAVRLGRRTPDAALASKQPVLTAHVVLKRADGDTEAVRRSLAAELDALFGIGHVTIQVESADCGGESRHR